MSQSTISSSDYYFQNLAPRTDKRRASTIERSPSIIERRTSFMESRPVSKIGKSVTFNSSSAISISKPTTLKSRPTSSRTMPGKAVRSTSARVFRPSHKLDIKNWKVVRQSDENKRISALERAKSVNTKDWIEKRSREKHKFDDSVEEISVEQEPISKEEKVKKWITRDSTLSDIKSLRSFDRSLDSLSIAGTFATQLSENKKLKAIEEIFEMESESGTVTFGTSSRKEIIFRDVPFINSPEETAYLLAVRITNKMIKDGWYELFGPICYIDVVKDGEFNSTCTVRLGMWDSSTHKEFIKTFNGTLEKLKFYGKTLIMKSAIRLERTTVIGWENPEAPVSSQPGKLSPIDEVRTDFKEEKKSCCHCCSICCAACTYMGLAFQLSFNFFCKTLGNYASSQKVSVSQDTARSERSNLDTVRSEKSNLGTDRY